MSGFLHVPSPLPAHDLITIVVHVVLDAISFLENVILLLAVVYRTPSSQKFVGKFCGKKCANYRRSYAVLILNCIFVDLIAGVCSLLSITRY